MHHHIPLVNLSLPRVVPDANGDGILDILALCAVTLPSGVSDHHIHVRTNLVMVSGSDGTVLGRPYRPSWCSELHGLRILGSLDIRFFCNASNEGKQHASWQVALGESLFGGLNAAANDEFELSLGDLYQELGMEEPARDDDLGDNLVDPTKDGAAAFIQLGNLEATDEHQETVRDSIHFELIPSHPPCRECGVTAQLWDGFAHHLLWTKTWRNAFAFHPVSTRFETDRRDSPIEGFAFRLWQWRSTPGEAFQRRLPFQSPSSQDFVTTTERQKFTTAPWNYRTGFLKSTGDVHFSHPENARTLTVVESIVYVTLNHSTPTMTILFTHEIVQPCTMAADSSCKPHVDPQPKSSKGISLSAILSYLLNCNIS